MSFAAQQNAAEVAMIKRRPQKRKAAEITPENGGANDPPASIAKTIAAAKRRASQQESAIAEIVDAKRDLTKQVLIPMIERRSHLRKEKRQNELIASLYEKGAASWNQLDHANKWQKAHVLAVLWSPVTPLPRAMTGMGWLSEAPSDIRNQRDLFLARLARPDFVNNGPLLIPQFQKDDKEAMLVTMRFCPVKETLRATSSFFSSQYSNDPDVFRAFLANPNASPKYLKAFSVSIRQNPELMVEAAATELLGPAAVLDHCCRSLLGSFSFASTFVAAVDKIPDTALGEFSEFVRAYKFIVLAFVRKNAATFKDASPRLRGNATIVRVACKQDPVSTIAKYATDKVKQQLGCDKRFMVNLFFKVPAGEGYPEFYRMLSPTLKYDYDLILKAHITGCFEVDDLPATLASDPDFWKDIICDWNDFWHLLPGDFANDPIFVRSISRFDCADLVDAVFARFEFLKADRGIWSSVVKDVPYGGLYDLVHRHAPVSIRSDKAIMTSACEKHFSILRIVDAELLSHQFY